MAYPIESINPASSEEEMKNAVQQTVEQLISEGSPPEQAQQKAMQMLEGIMKPSPTAGFSGKSSTSYGSLTMNQNSRFARGSSSGPQNRATSVPNPLLNNWNPPGEPSYREIGRHYS